MSITPEIEADVLRIHRANPKRFSPFKVSKSVGCTVNEVNRIVLRHQQSLTNGKEHNGGQGREDLQSFIVAGRRANDPGWNNQDAGVKRAREAYEAGTHTMATHRDGAWIYLCLFPLDRPEKPRPGYFQG